MGTGIATHLLQCDTPERTLTLCGKEAWRDGNQFVTKQGTILRATRDLEKYDCLKCRKKRKAMFR